MLSGGRCATRAEGVTFASWTATVPVIGVVVAWIVDGYTRRRSPYAQRVTSG